MNGTNQVWVWFGLLTDFSAGPDIAYFWGIWVQDPIWGSFSKAFIPTRPLLAIESKTHVWFHVVPEANGTGEGGLKIDPFTICHSYHHEADRVLVTIYIYIYDTGVFFVAKFHHLATQNKGRGAT